MTTNALQLCVQYLQAGDFDKAEESVRRLLRQEPRHAPSWCLLGLIRQARGRADEAVTHFQEALRLDPQFADARNHLGGAFVQMRQPNQAITHLEEALRLRPFFPEAYNNLGKAYLLLDRGDESLNCFREAVRLHPNLVEALNNLALVLIARRQFAEARPVLQRVAQLAPNFAAGFVSLSALHFQENELDKALTAAQEAVRLDPRQAATQSQLGAVLLKMGRHPEALAALQAALAAAPDHIQAREHLGLALVSLGRMAEAVDCLKRAAELDPSNVRVLSNLIAVLIDRGSWAEVAQAASLLVRQQLDAPEALHNLGLAYLHLRQPQSAIPVLERAVQLKPNYAEGLCSLGWAFTDTGQLDRARTVLQESIRLKPDFAEALNNLGLVYNQAGDPEASREAYLRAVHLRPTFPEALGGLGNVCKDLGLLDEAIASYKKSVAVNPRQPTMYGNLLLSLHYVPSATPDEIFQEHLAWARHNATVGITPRPHSNDRDPERRLRVGYVSTDFRGHVMGWYIEPVLECHDRERFEIFCYADVGSPDDATQRMQKLANHWRDIRNLADDAVEDAIRRDRIDLLVDLNGHTGGNRLPLFARKPAPVQASHFGYMDTTGLTAIDYRITDTVCDPPGQTERYHTEQLVRLPDILWCYRANLSLEVNPLPAASVGHVTFGMFNAFPKITAPAIAAWANILQRVPGSRLILLAGVSPKADRRLLDAFAGHGIRPERLILEGKRSRLDYFRLFHRVDVLLDSFPYTGCNTTCDSLWMGVPVVTLAGLTCMARQGASPLAHLGLRDLIAETTTDYVETAVHLAGDLPRLTELRSGLRPRMSASTLMNPPRFTRQLEEAYRWMWRQWCLR